MGPLTPPGDWVEDAACAGADLDLFFPPPGPTPHLALSYCYSCPVQATCLRTAMENRETLGVWGGMTRQQRRGLAKGQLPPAPEGLHWEWNEEQQGWQLAWSVGHA